MSNQLFIYISLTFSMIDEQIAHAAKIKIFEHGTRILGDKLVFIHEDKIPAFLPTFDLNLTHTRSDLESKYSYIKAEYINTLSAVEVSYNENTTMLNFYIKLPFMQTEFGVMGFAIPKRFQNRVY